mmetsp:Transcript_21519/g.48890  ORF Transcript_21519/g.48890 Transcript_21519/m.48890 type:complete len:136 (+) Transcript_21519:2331-2738(+)
MIRSIHHPSEVLPAHLPRDWLDGWSSYLLYQHSHPVRSIHQFSHGKVPYERNGEGRFAADRCGRREMYADVLAMSRRGRNIQRGSVAGFFCVLADDGGHVKLCMERSNGHCKYFVTAEAPLLYLIKNKRVALPLS